MEKPPARTLDAIASHAGNPDAIVEAGELTDMRFSSGNRLSLRGGKLFHLLIQAAGVRIADPIQHRLTLAALNTTFHLRLAELDELIDELASTVIKLRLTDATGRRYLKTGPLLSDTEREDDDQAQAELRFEFSPTMRRAIGSSTHWAVISRRAMLTFESKYSLRLYTLLSLRTGMRKAHEDFTLEDIRALLGVPKDKLTSWQAFKLRALDVAVEEINHLAGFTVSYLPKKLGKRVIGVTIAWGVKEQAGRIEALKELERPKVGRKARREGTVEAITTESVFEADDRQRLALAEALARAGQ